MKYLLTYVYDGIREGKTLTGQGSTLMTVNGTDKITPEVITNAIEWVRNDFVKGGTRINTIVPMGWFKFDEEDEVKDDE